MANKIIARAVLLRSRSRSPAARPRPTRTAPTPAVPNVRLTKAQQAHIQLYTVVPVGYRQKVRGARHGRFRQRPGDVGRLAVHRPRHAHLRRARPACRQGPAARAGPVRRLCDCGRQPIARPWSLRPTRGGVANADRDLAAHNGISEREAAQAQTDAASAEADREAALQSLLSMGVDRGTIARAMAGSPTAGLAGVIRAPVSGVIVDKRSRPGSCSRPAHRRPSPSPICRRSGCWRRLRPSDLSPIGVPRCGARSIRATAPGRSTARSRTSPRRSIRTPARSSRGSSPPIPATCSRSRCTSTFRSNPGASAPACWCRCPRYFATMRICRSSTSRCPTAASPGATSTLGYRDSQNYDVTSGLASGDRIVSNGALFLQFMQSQ